MKACLIVCCIAAAASGCATTGVSDITVRNALPEAAPLKTYAIDPASRRVQESEAYENVLRAELDRHGYREVAHCADECLRVALRFATKSDSTTRYFLEDANSRTWSAPTEQLGSRRLLPSKEYTVARVLNITFHSGAEDVCCTRSSCAM